MKQAPQTQVMREWISFSQWKFTTLCGAMWYGLLQNFHQLEQAVLFGDRSSI